ncbi:MAG TPA: hypothetical protein DHV89_06250 [Ruminococcus sp.]|nr:hypothetical protein [Ruminococcus sp.]
MEKKADERLKTENVVNDDICLHLLYGYYGGNLTKTDEDDMKDFVIAQAAGWNRDWSVNLAITALSKIIKDENGTFEDRYDTNAVKLLGIFLREKNVKYFLEFKGITHSCPKLKEAFDCFETIDEFSKYATNALTVVDALRSVMKTAEDIKEAEDNGAAVDYAAAFRNVKDAVVSSLIVFFPSIRPLLTVYSGLIDSIVDSFKEAIYDPLFTLATDVLWEEYETSGDDYKMQLANKIAYTLNMDNKNGDNFEWKISDRNLLTIEELEYIYNNNSLNSSQFRDGFGKYTQWRCTEEIYSSMGGKESFEEFQKLLKDLSKDNKFIRNNYDEKSWSDFWKDFIDDKDTGAGSGDSGSGGNGDSGNGGNGGNGNSGSGNSGNSGHSDDGSSDVTFGDCIDETVSDYIEWMRDHSKTVDDF